MKIKNFIMAGYNAHSKMFWFWFCLYAIGGFAFIFIGLEVFLGYFLGSHVMEHLFNAHQKEKENKE